MAIKEYALAFAINAKLASTFGSSFSKAQSTVAGLGAQASETDKLLSGMSGIVKARQEVQDSDAKCQELLKTYLQLKRSWREAGKEQDALAKQYEVAKRKLTGYEKTVNQSGDTSDEVVAAYERQKAEVKRLGDALKAAEKKTKDCSRSMQSSSRALNLARSSAEKQRISLKSLEGQMGTTGVKTEDLIKKERQLEQQFAATRKASGLLSAGLKNMAKGSAGMAAVGGAVYGIVRGPVKSAMELEDAMADLAKVTNLSDEDLKRMQVRFEQMSLTIPRTANGLVQIAAAAAGAGVAEKDLEKFTEQAAKMAVAFDVTDEAAGTMMAKWQSGMKLSLQDTFALADAVNQLSNSNAATGAQIGDAIQRYGALGKVAGLTEKQTAALATSLIASGATSETAATGMKAFMGALSKGGTMSELQAAAFSNVGFDPKELQKRLQENGTQTILDVLEAINAKIPKEKRTMYLNAMFGETGMEAIGPLLTNLTALRKNFALVADSESYAGSMEKEFAARAKTTSNALQLVQNAADGVSRALGGPLLEPLREVSIAIVGVAAKIGDWMRANQELVKTALYASGAIAGFVASFYGFKLVKGVVQTVVGGTMKGLMTLGKYAGWLAKAIPVATAVMSKSFASVAPVVARLGLAFKAAFLNPVGLAIGAVASLVAGGVWLYRNWDRVATFFSENFPTATKIASSAIEAVGKGFDWVNGKIEGVASFLTNTFVPVWQSALGSIVKLINWVISKMNKISFEIPKEVPFIGGKKFGVNIPLIGTEENASTELPAVNNGRASPLLSGALKSPAPKNEAATTLNFSPVINVQGSTTSEAKANMEAGLNASLRDWLRQKNLAADEERRYSYS